MEGISIETYQLIYEWNKNQKYRKLKADAVKSPLNTFFHKFVQSENIQIQ